MVEPPSLCMREVDQGLVCFYRSTLAHPLSKEEGWERCTTLDGRVPTIFDELLAGDLSGSLCPIR
jgi:hypothetical protein